MNKTQFLKETAHNNKPQIIYYVCGRRKKTSKDQTLGALILALCVIVALTFLILLFMYDPYIISFLNLGATADVRFWLIATPVTIAFIGIMIIGVWIGLTMVKTPPPKPKEITTQTETQN